MNKWIPRAAPFVTVRPRLSGSTNCGSGGERGHVIFRTKETKKANVGRQRVTERGQDTQHSEDRVPETRQEHVRGNGNCSVLQRSGFLSLQLVVL